VETQRKPEELTDEERQRLHRAHQHVRNASQQLEALTVIDPMPRRWAAQPAPVEALHAATAELNAAVQGLWQAQHELLALERPADPTP
jgi:hypothetical protein